MSMEEGKDLIASSFSEEAIVEAVARIVTCSYEKCSLCNNIIEGEVDHWRREHPHVQHIHEMVAKPIPPLQAGESEGRAAMDIGSFAVAASIKADRGEAAFRIVQRAQAQLHRLLENVERGAWHVYLFGSVVSMGSWDGVGDSDFSFVCRDMCQVPDQDGQLGMPEEGVEEDNGDEAVAEEEAEEEEGAAVGDDDTCGTAAAEKAQSPGASLRAEKRIIHKIVARLRGAGFRFEELDPVLHTRIPVVRRKQAEHEPLSLHSSPQKSLIRVRFGTTSAEAQFRKRRLREVISSYNAEEMPNQGTEQGRSLLLSVPDPIDAIRLISGRERIYGVRKEWAGNHRSPEIFSIDFDLSCRHHGIRNSWLLRRYFEQSEVFRVGNVFLKMWSKACGVNHSRVGFLTSYAVSVLWIYFLLRRGEVAFVNPADIPALPNPEEQMEVPYIPLWPDVANAEANAARTARLGRLLQGFFYFYAEEFDWDWHVVSIRQPCDSAASSRTKVDLGWEKSDTVSLVLRNRCYHIFSIEDVYEDDLDLGRHLTPEKAAWTRLQFRLAYRRCCSTRSPCGAAQASPLWKIFDTPRRRAEDVLRARLYTYLLRHTENAAAPIADILQQLISSTHSAKGYADTDEDPMYLACAYELSNRLCDLWFDAAQVAQDTAFHKMHDRRSTDYTPPVNPTKRGEWAAVCTDDLQEHEDPTVAHQRRSVQLTPPLSTKASTLEPQVEPAGSPACEWSLQLIESRRKYDDYASVLRARAGNRLHHASAAVIGAHLSKAAAGALYPHCFYPLQQQRLFGTYEAREIFTRCAGDVVAELQHLSDRKVPAALEDSSGVLHDHHKLLQYLKKRLFPIAAAADPNYEAVLRFLCRSREPYIHAIRRFRGSCERPTLRPTQLLLDLVDSSSSAASVAAKPKAPRQ
ncbi:hypothetical protein LSCM1_06319 [Leishmania martiniquensis]|uniref:RNA uridylyltransferase n=1 Tax=Leishmania martiniquensis TaxID=1580590 RepID=A0A836HAJ8_9TRYP|nr:hypothetical protein LSCM1_06319 [Leishmania martiniquensis]